jgi:glutamate synthase (NADPH/NADH) large chain
MGTDTPISASSNKSKLLHTYFKQNFAQVTNPPIDPIREELVMSLVSFIGPRPNLLDLKARLESQKRLEVRQPILTNERPGEDPRSVDTDNRLPDTKTLDITYSAADGADGMEARWSVCATVPKRRCTGGYNIIILSDRQIGPDRIAIPSLLATAAPCTIT